MRTLLTAALCIALCAACGEPAATGPAPGDAPAATRVAETADGPDQPAVPPAPAHHEPIELYEGGAHRTVDAADEPLLHRIDLGDAWTPVLFEESDGPGAPTLPHPYRATYLALARGEFPDDHHGARAREDKYLELYGIPPTLTVLRERMRHAAELACVAELDLAPLERWSGYVGYEDSRRAITEARRLAEGERLVARLRTAQGLVDGGAPDASSASRVEQDSVRAFLRAEGRFLAVAAAQKRLECEGYFRGRGRYVRGALDWATHEAIAEFERRHRMFGWGNLGRDTLAALRKAPLELEREAVVRVLLERAMHESGFVEDGSVAQLADGSPNTYVGADGREHPVPNLEETLRADVIAAFGLATVASTRAFLDGLGEVGDGRVVGFRGVAVPEYHSADMDLAIEIDRGDVWYDFPYDERGQERGQGVERRPNLTVFTTYRGRRIPLARFGTTIGGWRTELVNGVVMWAYKESPPGSVVWNKIVSAPVWLPPESAPPRSLLARTRTGWAPDLHETGPSYASAYGLVAAYHRPYVTRADGTIELRGDQGIRSHGSVDYMSIARRHSHGCHRLQNHLAVRLMSFVLRHRAHRRVGEDHVAYTRHVEHEGKRYTLNVTQGGYEFALDTPIPVEVLPGRILGERTTPVAVELPRFDPALGVYLLPDGGAATVDRLGNVTPVPFPHDAGGPDAGAASASDAGARPAGAVLDAAAAPRARDGGVSGPRSTPAPTSE